MRVSYNWLKEYLPLQMPAQQLADVLTGLGLEVSSLERVASIKGGLHGVVAGKVMACAKHPNADRLSLTKVDTGSGTLLSIVCGAPNVAEGQMVWVATVGTTLYPAGSAEPLRIAKAKVRGEISEGMICAADELGLGDDHSGIIVLPDSVSIGTLATEYYDVTEDDIIDIELTPNRSDAICHTGIARDLAAWSAIHGDAVTLRMPQVPGTFTVSANKPVSVEVNNTEACPRYCGITLSGITVRESPAWLQSRLRAIDVRPINHVVDITNFILHELGQPLHAFDADKISTGRVVVKTLPAGTSFVTLDSTERKLTDTDLMICDGDDTGMCIAGVYGGLGTGITEKTTRVFLESAHFHPRWIRRTAVRHDLRTDAARTFEKSTDPNICRYALLRAVQLILDTAGGEVSSELVDLYPVPVLPRQIHVRWERINTLTGAPLSQEEVQRILAALEMEIVQQVADGITIAVPTNKADVTREADVIEEILRIYGFDNVLVQPRLGFALSTPPRRSLSSLRESISAFLSAQGFLEAMGLSLLESRSFDKGPLQIPEQERVLINNTSNVHLDMMRHDLLASAMETVRFNHHRMQNDLMLFECGRTYRMKNKAIVEEERLTLTLAGTPAGTGWRGRGAAADFFVLKKYVLMLLDRLQIIRSRIEAIQGAQWEYALTCHSASGPLVSFGRVSAVVMKQFDLRIPVYFADFGLKSLFESMPAGEIQVQEISRFPEVHRDIAIVVPKDIPYAAIEQSIARSGGALLAAHLLFDLYENAEVLGAGRRSLAVALVFRDMQRTLTDEEVQAAVAVIVRNLEKETGAVLR